MKEYAIKLSEKQLQYVLNVLNERPHREVRDLIDTIIQQAESENTNIDSDSK